MNYIKQLNAFYDWLQGNRLSTSAFALYHALLMVNNSCGWTDWFQRTNQALCALVGVSENTLKKARNELKQKGLIDFKPGSRKNNITKYRIILLYSVSKFDTQVDTKTDTKVDTKTDTKVDTKEPANTDISRTPRALNYKLKTKTETKTINNSISNEIVSFNNDTPPRPPKENIPYHQIAELFNGTCLSLPKIEKITDKRRRHIKTAWKNFGGDMSKFEEVFRRAEASDFLSGRNGKWTGCNFDWLVTYNNMVKVLEGTYDNKKAGGFYDEQDSQHRRNPPRHYQRSGTYNRFYE